jgi:hypothetical protein
VDPALKLQAASICQIKEKEYLVLTVHLMFHHGWMLDAHESSTLDQIKREAPEFHAMVSHVWNELKQNLLYVAVTRCYLISAICYTVICEMFTDQAGRSQFYGV